MAISSADYETAASTAELAGARAGAQALADTTTAARGIAPDFNPWTAAATAASAALAELVKQTKELHQWAARQIPASGEMTGAPSPQQARPNRDATGDARREKENILPPDRVIHAEKAAAKAGVELDGQPEKEAANSGVKLDDQPVEGGSTEQPPAGPRQIIPPGQAPPKEQTENAVRPELPGAGRDLQNRFDVARGRVSNQTQGDQAQELLGQAITLLESLSQHPAIRDYAANKRKLEEIEQRLNQSGNVF